MANEPGNRTDYNSLYKPVDGEDGTGDNYRNDMDTIDARLIKSGDISERPSEAPTGAIFIEDETSSGSPGAKWRYDGSTWQKLPVNTDVVSAESMTLSGAVDADSASITNTMSAGSVDADSASVTNDVSAGSASITNDVSASSASISGAMSSDSASVTNGVTAGSVDTERVLDDKNYPIAMTKGYATFVDPSDYADDSAAIQALNDDLVANMSPNFVNGVVRIPPLKPDGTQWNFPSTVTLGETDSDVMVSLQGTEWGDSSSNDPWTTSITDGSPVFHIAGDIPGNSAAPLIMPVGGFTLAGGQGQDVEGLRLTNVKKFKLDNIRLVHFAQGDVSEGAVVFEGSCFNSEVDRTYYVAYNMGTTESKKTDVFKYVSRDGVKGPGEIVFGPGVRARQGYGYMFNDSGATDATSIYWHGHTERWEQDYAMNITVSDLRIGNDTIFGHPDDTSTGGNVLYFDGGVLSISEGADMGAPISGGTSVHVASASMFSIHPFNIFGGNSNVTAIDVDSNPAKPSVLPPAKNLNGSLSAIGGSNVRFPDGAKPGGSGTTTVPTGGSSTEVIGGNETYDPKVLAYAQSNPGAAMELDKRVYFDGAANNWKVEFSWATDPGSNVTFDYESRFYGG